jgi:hypothetical protein
MRWVQPKLHINVAYFAMGHLGGTGRTLWNVFGDASGALEAVEGANLVAVAFTKLDDADTDILTNRHGFAIIDVTLDASGNAESVVLYNPYGEDRTATPDGADDGFIELAVEDFAPEIQDFGGITTADFSKFDH